MNPDQPPEEDRVGGERTEDVRAVHSALRAHELELNRATAAFEHAVIAPLTVVNGGDAAAAWLTFVADSGSNRETLGAAVFWGFGLGLAILAAFLGWRRQQAYTKAERFRREAWELLWLGSESPVWEDLRQIVTTVAYQSAEWTEPLRPWQHARQLAAASGERGAEMSRMFQLSVATSAGAFVAGALWAVITISS